jgi:hypothetical protein
MRLLQDHRLRPGPRATVTHVAAGLAIAAPVEALLTTPEVHLVAAAGAAAGDGGKLLGVEVGQEPAGDDGKL